MSFSSRLGVVPEKIIQIESIEAGLRNRLYNYLSSWLDSIEASYYNIASQRGYEDELNSQEVVCYVLDKKGLLLGESHKNWTKFVTMFLSGEWFIPYDLIELCIERVLCMGDVYITHLEKNINDILEEEKSGYRLLNRKFIPIATDFELSSVRDSTITPYDVVNMHMKKSLSLYSDRQNPDYENSIKESISAVEALCCTITGLSGGQATLGKTIGKLKENNVQIHRALEKAFCSLYGYTSDEAGIRHGGINFKNAPAEDAKYMLVSCSAFINYLIEKLSKVKGGLI